jgi:hypothetical protein
MTDTDTDRFLNELIGLVFSGCPACGGEAGETIDDDAPESFGLSRLCEECRDDLEERERTEGPQPPPPLRGGE